MALTLVPKRVVALAEQLNAYYRVLRGTDPDSLDLRLNGGGHFIIHHSGTNAPLFSVTDAGAFGSITPIDGSVDNAKLAADAVTTDKVLNGTLVDADLNAAAGVQVSKLAHVGAGNVLKSNGTQNVGAQVANADVSPTAAIGLTKLAHVGAGNVLKSDGTQNVAGQVANADVSPAAGIVYSKLSLVSSIVNGDVAAAAAIALSKLAAGSAGVLKSNGTAITAGNLIVTSDMGANTINGDRIQDSTLPGSKILGGAPPPNGTGAADAWKVYATDAAGTTVALRQVAGEMFAPGVGMVRIATSGQLGSSQATFAFTSIPQTYTSLRIYLLARSTTAAAQDNVYLTVNGLTSGYYGEMMYGNGAVAAAIENTLGGTSAQAVIGAIAAASAPAGLPGAAVVELPGYATTSLGKSWLTTNGHWLGTSANQTVVRAAAGFFNVAGGITSITLGPSSGASFAAGSICALYGIP